MESVKRNKTPTSKIALACTDNVCDMKSKSPVVLEIFKKELLRAAAAAAAAAHAAEHWDASPPSGDA